MPVCPLTLQSCIDGVCGDGRCAELTAPSLVTCPHCNHAITWAKDGTGTCCCPGVIDDEDPDLWLDRPAHSSHRHP